MAAALGVACASTPPRVPDVEVSDGRYVMGTVLEITLAAASRERATALLRAAFAEAERLDALFTRYDDASALSELNRAAGRGPVPVPEELRHILVEAVAGSAATEGSFDVTVGPLVALWISAARRDRLPSEGEIAAALEKVGSQRIGLGGLAQTGVEEPADGALVEIPLPGMSVDLGGIAKGFALDRIVEELRREGVTRAFLSFGGSSVWALGASEPGGDGWHLALRDASGEPTGRVTLRDVAFSVSSSLGQSSWIGGERVGHVVDPRSGDALRRGAQAAVIADNATSAEIWSTALVVLEAERGIGLVDRDDALEARVLSEEGEGRESRGFRERTRFERFGAARE